jgi:hypothetical protein
MKEALESDKGNVVAMLVIPYPPHKVRFTIAVIEPTHIATVIYKTTSSPS